jgi:hypothetical protein
MQVEYHKIIKSFDISILPLSENGSGENKILIMKLCL